MSQEVNVLALVKGAERYIFLYNDENRAPNVANVGTLRVQSESELHVVRRGSSQPANSAPVRAANRRGSGFPIHAALAERQF